MHCFVDVAPGYRLWAEDIPGPAADSEVVLLIMGANASGTVWPDAFLERLAERYRVIRYDHRDTGQSTCAFDDWPYSVADLAEDAIMVLDAFDVDRAHVVGMSLGGVLVQLLLLDFPDRLLSATVLCTAALGSGLATEETGTGQTATGQACAARHRAAEPEPEAEPEEELPGPDRALLRMWLELGDERDLVAELDWRVEHWRLLNGTGTEFDAESFRELEERVIAHSGRIEPATAHAYAYRDGLDRGDELAAVEVPTLVVEAPEDPVNPPPHAAHLAAAIGSSRLVTIPGMGHALNPPVIEPLAAAILDHTARAAAARA